MTSGARFLTRYYDLRVVLNGGAHVRDDPSERWKYGREVDAAYFRLAACGMELDRAVKARATSEQQRRKASRPRNSYDIAVAAAREWIEREGKDSPAESC